MTGSGLAPVPGHVTCQTGHMTSDDRIVAIVGPTASGKSDLSVAFALATQPAEIINIDAMQIYRGMNVGTAKLRDEERRGVRHHLLDMIEVTEPSTVAEFQTLARVAIEDCHTRGVLPVLVGGSALYLRAVLDKFEFPGTDAAARARWETRLAELGPVALHQELMRLDPVAADQILETNVRRVVRALEVIEITGKPFAASLPPREHAFAGVTMIGLDVGREDLSQRIQTRVDAMWAAGFVDEVRDLADHGLRKGRTANRAIGYSQVLAFLDGECSQEEARSSTVTRTRQFARRQDAWFRKDPRIRWLPYDAPDLLDRALQLLDSMPDEQLYGQTAAGRESGFDG